MLIKNLLLILLLLSSTSIQSMDKINFAKNTIIPWCMQNYSKVGAIVGMLYALYYSQTEYRKEIGYTTDGSISITWETERHRNLPTYKIDDKWVDLIAIPKIYLKIKGKGSFYCTIDDLMKIRTNLKSLSIEKVPGDANHFAPISLCNNLTSLYFNESSLPNEILMLTQLESLRAYLISQFC